MEKSTTVTSAQVDALLAPLFARADEDVLARCPNDVTLPVAFMAELTAATSRGEILEVYAGWTRRILGSDHCSIALMDVHGNLILTSLDGGKGLHLGAVRSADSSIIGAVYRLKQPIYVPDISALDHDDARSVAARGYHTAFIVPIKTRDRCFGTLSASFVASNEDPRVLLTKIEAMANCMAAQLTVLEQLEALAEMAHTDALTGAKNRHTFDKQTLEAWTSWKATKNPFGFLTIDIDHFKAVNDTFGHDVGDDVLRQLSRRLLGHVRSKDIVFRLGGEEFAVLLPEATPAAAREVARRLLFAIREEPFLSDGRLIRVTASLGVTNCDRSDGSAADILKRSDKALYHAKTSGRNRMVWATPRSMLALTA